jgi:glycosyltransferase involved in cell wall biosynthesis
MYENVAKLWGNNVITVSTKTFPNERKMCKMDAPPNCIQTFFTTEMSEDEICEFINQYKKDIFIFSGFRGEKRKYLYYLLDRTEAKVIVITERPNFSGDGIEVWLKKITYKILYRFLSIKYKYRLTGILAMGKRGCETFASYGFNKSRLFPFMYCSGGVANVDVKSNSSLTKFIYIGRFDKKIKGVDILTSVLKRLSESDWCFDFVGGYGDYKDQVFSFVEAYSNISYLGKWDFTDVVENLSNYDVAIVPSKSDGWNLIVNQAICANIGVIATDETVSDELIDSSGAGIVISARNEKALKDAMEYAIRNPNEVKNWKDKASIYMDRISVETVSTYFVNVMDYILGNTGSIPNCPWL